MARVVKIRLLYAALLALGIVFSLGLYATGAFAASSNLAFDHNEIGWSSGCTYYRLSYSDTPAKFATDVTSLKTVELMNVVGQFENVKDAYGSWEWLVNESYANTVANCTTKCNPFNYTAINTTTVTDQNCTQSCKPYNVTAYRNAWKPNYASTLATDKTTIASTLTAKGYVPVRFCSDFTREATKEGWAISIDHVPQFAGTTYDKMTWWNSTWARCKNITFSYGSDHPASTTFEPIEMNLTGLTFTSTDELRLVNTSCNNGGTEAAYAVLSNTSTSAYVVTEANLTANNTVWSVYYDSVGAAAPDYSSALFTANIYDGAGYNITNRNFMLYNDSAAEADTDDWYLTTTGTWTTNQMIGTNYGFFPYDANNWAFTTGTVTGGALLVDNNLMKRYNWLTNEAIGNSNITVTWYRDSDFSIWNINTTYNGTVNGGHRNIACNGCKSNNWLFNLSSTYALYTGYGTSDASIIFATNTSSLFAFGFNDTADSYMLGMLADGSSVNGGGFMVDGSPASWSNTGSNYYMGVSGSTTTTNVIAGTTMNMTFVYEMRNASDIATLNNTWAMLRNPPAVSLGTEVSNNYAPAWSANTSSIPLVYYSTTNACFNVTWTDDNDANGYNVSLFSSNYTGIWTNYSTTRTGNSSGYCAVMPAGILQWKFYANDSSNAWNSTDTWTWAVAAPTGSIVIAMPANASYMEANTTVSFRPTGSYSGYTCYRNIDSTNVSLGTIPNNTDNSTIAQSIGYQNHLLTVSCSNDTLAFSAIANFTTVPYSIITANDTPNVFETEPAAYYLTIETTEDIADINANLVWDSAEVPTTTAKNGTTFNMTTVRTLPVVAANATAIPVYFTFNLTFTDNDTINFLNSSFINQTLLFGVWPSTFNYATPTAIEGTDVSANLSFTNSSNYNGTVTPKIKWNSNNYSMASVSFTNYTTGVYMPSVPTVTPINSSITNYIDSSFTSNMTNTTNSRSVLYTPGYYLTDYKMVLVEANATYTEGALIYYYYDEKTNASLTGCMPSYTHTLRNNNVTETYTGSVTGAECGTSTQFSIWPDWAVFNVTADLSYDNKTAGYEMRYLSKNFTDVNASTITRPALYLLATGSGQYVSFYIQEAGLYTPISGALVEVYRNLGGTNVSISSKLSDSSGSASFYLDYTAPYVINVSKSGYYTSTGIITPVGTSYPIQLSPMAGTYSNYSSTLWYGLTMERLPAGLGLFPQIYTFNYTLMDSNSSLEYYGMNLYYCPNTTCTNVYSNNTTTSSGGSITQAYNLANASGNLIMETWFGKTGYTEWIDNRTYTIWTTYSSNATGYVNRTNLTNTSLAGIIESMKSDTGAGIDQFSYSILMIFMVIISMGGSNRFIGANAGVVIGLIVLAMFVLIGNYIFTSFWLGWLIFSFLAVGMVGYLFVSRGL